MRLCYLPSLCRFCALSVLLLAGCLLLPTAALAQEPVTQDPAEPLSERYEITAADRDTSDFNKQAIRQQLLHPYETLSLDKLETGLLYDRMNVLSEAEKYAGRGDTTIDYGSWRQLYFEMQTGQVSSRSNLPKPSSLKSAASQKAQSETIPVGVINLRYDKIKETAVEAGLIEVRGGQLYDVSGSHESPYQQRVAFAAAPMKETLEKKSATFELDRDFYVENRAHGPPEYFEIDLGDGRGFRRAAFGDRLRATYAANGVKTGRVRAHFSDGSQLEGAFALEVNSVPDAPCDRTWGTPGATQKSAFAVSDDAYEGKKAYFTACAIYGDGHSSLEKPLILAEGFDIFGKLDIDRIYEDYGTLTDGLTGMGFDVIILNYFDAKTHMQRNAETLITLLRDVNELKTTREPNVVIGASMGGIVARYALVDMEVSNEEHETNVYISFDSPHEGANIPLGLQYSTVFFAGFSEEASEFKQILGRPAARQLLVRHWLSSNNEIPKSDQMHYSFWSNFPYRESEEGRHHNYPVENGMWNVGIANGSGQGEAQENSDGETMPSGDDAMLLDIFGGGGGNFAGVAAEAWAVPSGDERTKIFEGEKSCPFPIPGWCSRLVRYIDTPSGSSPTSKPYDNAPGGWRPSGNDLADPAEEELRWGHNFVVEMIGNLLLFLGLNDVEAPFERHAFVPTISALDIPTGNGLPLATGGLFHDMAADPTLPNKTPLPPVEQGGTYTPFDILRYADHNEPHVFPGNVRRFIYEQASYVRESRVIENKTISTAKPLQRAREELVARDVTLTEDADVILASGRTVRLGPGFRAEEGAKLRVYTDPAISEPPSLPSGTSSPAVLASTEGSEETAFTSNAAMQRTDAGQEESTAAALSKQTRAVPDEFSLGANYPNPFRTSTEIRFGLPEAAEVSLEVYDMLGRRVARLAEGQMRAGYHRARLDGSKLSSGVYVYRLVAGDFTDTGRMVLVK